MIKKEMTKEEKIKFLAKYLSVSESTIKTHIANGDIDTFAEKRMDEVEFLRKEIPYFKRQSRRDIGNF